MNLLLQRLGELEAVSRRKGDKAVMLITAQALIDKGFKLSYLSTGPDTETVIVSKAGEHVFSFPGRKSARHGMAIRAKHLPSDFHVRGRQLLIDCGVRHTWDANGFLDYVGTQEQTETHRRLWCAKAYGL